MRKSPDLVIAHPMNSYHPGQGGGVRYLMNVLNYALARHKEVLVLGIDNNVGAMRNPAWVQVALIRKGIPVLRKVVPEWVRYLFNLFFALPFIKIPRKAVILTHRMDCMLAFVLFKRNNPKVFLSAAPAYYLRLKYPKIHKYFGWLYYWIEKTCILNVDLIIPTDRKTKQYYDSRYPGAKLGEIMPSPIDFNQFPIPDKRVIRAKLGWDDLEKVILFVGRLALVKNIPLLIDAFGIVEREISPSRLIIVGDGEEGETLRRHARNTSDRIYFTGALLPSEIGLYYSAADVTVLCSHEEGSPTVIKESLAVGTPVISTDMGDASDVLQNNAILGRIIPNSVESLGQALFELLSGSASDTDQIRTARRAAVTKFSLEKTGQELFSKFETIIENRCI